MNILLVDDHAIVRSGLRDLLVAALGANVSEAATGHDALQQVRRERPEMVLLDLNLPDFGGLDLLRKIIQAVRTVRVIVLTMHAEAAYAARAMALGARGYLSKNISPGELLTAVRRVSEGGRYIENEIAQQLALNETSPLDRLQTLTGRDLEIVRLLASGMNLTEIAANLGVGYKTVANRCSIIKSRLGVAGTNELIRLAITLGVS